jgi:hypothetical protein
VDKWRSKWEIGGRVVRWTLSMAFRGSKDVVNGGVKGGSYFCRQRAKESEKVSDGKCGSVAVIVVDDDEDGGEGN